MRVVLLTGLTGFTGLRSSGDHPHLDKSRAFKTFEVSANLEGLEEWVITRDHILFRAVV